MENIAMQLGLLSILPSHYKLKIPSAETMETILYRGTVFMLAENVGKQWKNFRAVIENFWKSLTENGPLVAKKTILRTSYFNGCF